MPALLLGPREPPLLLPQLIQLVLVCPWTGGACPCSAVGPISGTTTQACLWSLF